MDYGSILISVLVFSSVLLTTCSLAEPLKQRVRAFLDTREQMYQGRLREVSVRSISPRAVAGIEAACILCCFAGGYLLTHSLLWAVGAGFAGSFGPQAVFVALRRHRRQLLEQQLVDALSFLSNSVKAGLSLVQAIERVAGEMHPPIAEELGQMAREYHLGAPLPQVIQNARLRFQSDNFNLVANSLTINLDRGGNLPETLERMAESVREIFRLEEKIVQMTAEGRKSARVMAYVPLLVFVIMYLMDPENVTVLFTAPIGNLILFVGLVLYGVAFYWIRRIVNTPI